MPAIDLSGWTDRQRALWTRIAAHPFEPDGQALTFTGRLARDHGWTLGFARGAVEEYRRFCLLAVTAGVPMTPSEEVDEVWHLHLTFSRDYWERWCGVALGVPLHHDPTAGGSAEARRYATQYAETLARYEALFGPPDPVFWPGVADRFSPAGPRFRTVDRARVLILRKPTLLGRHGRRLRDAIGLSAFLSLGSAGPASALPINVLDWPASPFLMLYGALAAAALGLALGYAAVLRAGSGAVGRAETLAPISLAFLAGDAMRAADVMALELIQSGDLAIRTDQRLDATAAIGGPACLAPFRNEPVRRAKLPEALAPWLDPVHDRLAARGLLLSREEVARVRAVTACLVTPVVALGIVRILLGLSRNRPVGFLVALTVMTAVLGLMIAIRVRLATQAGRVALEAHAARHARAVRAPLPDEVTTAFAIAGATVLTGSALSTHAFFATKGADGSGGCGGGGDGGGGGGCGGCGGGD